MKYCPRCGGELTHLFDHIWYCHACKKRVFKNRLYDPPQIESYTKCSECGRLRKVYGQYERDYGQVKDIPKRDLLIEDDSKELKEDDVVGVPLCKQCYKLYGDDDE